jgi:large subunit ribosomal protein L21
MYAIIENGGKQYKVVEGMKVRLERFQVGEGEDVTIKEVLAVNDGSSTFIGDPYVAGAFVDGKVIAQGKGKKVIVFKYKRRKDYKKKNGHRQLYTEMLVEKIHLEEPHGA